MHGGRLTQGQAPKSAPPLVAGGAGGIAVAFFLSTPEGGTRRRATHTTLTNKAGTSAGPCGMHFGRRFLASRIFFVYTGPQGVA